MSSLFSISAELQDIILQLEEGEATEELLNKLAITEDNLKEKIGNYVNAIKRYNNDVVECKNEKDRINQIQKVRTNTSERLKNLVLEAVLRFGDTGKSGNYFVEGSTYKVFTRTSNSIKPKDILISNIIKCYINIVTNYIKEADINGSNEFDSLDLDSLALYISNTLTAEKIQNKKDLNEFVSDKDCQVFITRDDLLAIPINISININLAELVNQSNIGLLKWIDDNPHKTEITHNVSASSIKAHLALNASLHIYDEEEKIGLTIK